MFPSHRLASCVGGIVRSIVGLSSSRERIMSAHQSMEHAKHAEHERDLAMAKYHHFEVASAAFQIGIVLASATIITGMIALAWISGLLALTGLVFTAIGLFAPHAVHLM